MLVALRKRKENIVEYILYLYQIEDLIRAFKLDIDLINEKLIPEYKSDRETSLKISDWYGNLIAMMDKEGKRESGHLQFLINLISDLNEFHLRLKSTESDEVYNSSYKDIINIISELKEKNPKAGNEIEIALDGVYGYLILKIQKKKISLPTEEAVKRLSHWLGYLAQLYRDFETGSYEFSPG